MDILPTDPLNAKSNPLNILSHSNSVRSSVYHNSQKNGDRRTQVVIPHVDGHASGFDISEPARSPVAKQKENAFSSKKVSKKPTFINEYDFSDENKSDFDTVKSRSNSRSPNNKTIVTNRLASNVSK